MLNLKTVWICYECGHIMHKECALQWKGTKSFSFEHRNSCPICRTIDVEGGSKEQIERLQRLSQLGKPWAQFGLGMYLGVHGGNQDPKRACELLKLAAEQGYYHAQSNLGHMYQKGEGGFCCLHCCDGLCNGIARMFNIVLMLAGFGIAGFGLYLAAQTNWTFDYFTSKTKTLNN